jgi:hypothetical protein
VWRLVFFLLRDWKKSFKELENGKKKTLNLWTWPVWKLLSAYLWG